MYAYHKYCQNKHVRFVVTLQRYLCTPKVSKLKTLAKNDQSLQIGPAFGHLRYFQVLRVEFIEGDHKNFVHAKKENFKSAFGKQRPKRLKFDNLV